MIKLSDIYIQLILTILSVPIGGLLKRMNYLSFSETIWFCIAIALLIPLRIEKARHNEGILKRALSCFPHFNFETLKTYSKRWVKKYKVLRIKRIILCRCDTENQEKMILKFKNIVTVYKYAIVFVFSGSKDIELSKLYSYPNSADDKCTTALKEIKFADQLASLGKHRLFDQAFPKVVYKDIPDTSYYKEWTFILTRDKNISNVPNIYPDESVILWGK